MTGPVDLYLHLPDMTAGSKPEAVAGTKIEGSNHASSLEQREPALLVGPRRLGFTPLVGVHPCKQGFTPFIGVHPVTCSCEVHPYRGIGVVAEWAVKGLLHPPQSRTRCEAHEAPAWLDRAKRYHHSQKQKERCGTVRAAGPDIKL